MPQINEILEELGVVIWFWLSFIMNEIVLSTVTLWMYHVRHMWGIYSYGW